MHNQGIEGGGENAGRSSVDRGKMGIKRSTAVDASGVPLGAVSEPANHHDSPLLVPNLETASEALRELPEGASVHLDRAYDSRAPPASGFGSWACGGRSRGGASLRLLGQEEVGG